MAHLFDYWPARLSPISIPSCTPECLSFFCHEKIPFVDMIKSILTDAFFLMSTKKGYYQISDFRKKLYSSCIFWIPNPIFLSKSMSCNFSSSEITEKDRDIISACLGKISSNNSFPFISLQTVQWNYLMRSFLALEEQWVKWWSATSLDGKLEDPYLIDNHESRNFLLGGKRRFQSEQINVINSTDSTNVMVCPENWELNQQLSSHFTSNNK